jgi:release factor glutamine methyltransferase
MALDGGPDGFAAYRIIAASTSKLVTRGGFLAVEAGEGQAPEIARLFSSAGLTPQVPRKDLGGIERVVVAS